MGTQRFFKEQRLVVLGAGISGLLSAEVLAPHFAGVTILERGSQLDHQRQVLARDKHAHVCVAAALKAFEDQVPGFSESLRAAGFILADPGEHLRWLTASTEFTQAPIEKTCGMGSYRAFHETLRLRVAKRRNISTRYEARDPRIEPMNKTVTYMDHDRPVTLPYDILLIGVGGNGRESKLLGDSGIPYQTTVYKGRCQYHSFDISLQAPLTSCLGFVSDATPGRRLQSFLYVPRDQTHGILTVANFGGPLGLETLSDLRELLHAYRDDLPAEFLQKLEAASKASHFTFSESYYRQLLPQPSTGIYLVGDALLKVPPYLGLGLAIAVTSVLSVKAHLGLAGSRDKRSFARLFRSTADEIFLRLARYEVLWGSEEPASARRRSRWPQPLRRLARSAAKFVFAEARSSEAASRYLVERFHLTRDSRLGPLLSLTLKLGLSKLKDRWMSGNEKLSQAR